MQDVCPDSVHLFVDGGNASSCRQLQQLCRRRVRQTGLPFTRRARHGHLPFSVGWLGASLSKRVRPWSLCDHHHRHHRPRRRHHRHHRQNSNHNHHHPCRHHQYQHYHHRPMQRWRLSISVCLRCCCCCYCLSCHVVYCICPFVDSVRSTTSDGEHRVQLNLCHSAVAVVRHRMAIMSGNQWRASSIVECVSPRSS